MRTKSAFKRILAGLLAVIMILSSAPLTASAAGVPGLNASVTDKNILKLAKKYDKDAYYILNKMKKKGDALTRWYNGSQSIVDGIDTCVHEEFHGYTFDYGNYSSACYYMGNSKSVYVPYTTVFKTELATKKIKSKYRTFRYSTYVSPGSYLSSNEYGVYGLLNEFSAYYWGMHIMESLYPYLSAKATSVYDYNQFIVSYLNNKNAYAEFYYWTLLYLKYAKSKKPSVYKKIMANKKYVGTLYQMEKKFRSLMKKYDKDLNKLSLKYNGSGIKNNYKDGWISIGSMTLSSGYNDYDLLKPLIDASSFNAVKKDIKKNK